MNSDQMNSRSDIGLLQPTYHLGCWPFSPVVLQKYSKISHSLECYCQVSCRIERLCQLLLCSCLPDGELSLLASPFLYVIRHPVKLKLWVYYCNQLNIMFLSQMFKAPVDAVNWQAVHRVTMNSGFSDESQ